jgi:hypothetical protein
MSFNLTSADENEIVSDMTKMQSIGLGLSATDVR